MPSRSLYTNALENGKKKVSLRTSFMPFVFASDYYVTRIRANMQILKSDTQRYY